jgi:secreted protein with Ig-like and vWFA domain
MNPDQPSREPIEARITALLLGELPAAEAELLRWTISRDPELQKLHDQLKVTIGFVREATENPTGAPLDKETPLKMAQERRQTLLAHFKTARPQRLFWLRPIKASPLITALVVITIIALLAAMLLPVLSTSKMRSIQDESQSTLSSRDVRRLNGVANESEMDRKRSPQEPVAAPPPVQIALPNTASSETETVQTAAPVYSQNSAGNLDFNAGAPLPPPEVNSEPATGLPEQPAPNTESTVTFGPSSPPKGPAGSPFSARLENNMYQTETTPNVQPPAPTPALSMPPQPQVPDSIPAGGIIAGASPSSVVAADEPASEGTTTVGTVGGANTANWNLDGQSKSLSDQDRATRDVHVERAFENSFSTTNYIAINQPQGLYRTKIDNSVQGANVFQNLGVTPIPPASITAPAPGSAGNVSDFLELRPPPRQPKDTRDPELFASSQAKSPIVRGPRVVHEADDSFTPRQGAMSVPQPEVQTSDNAFSTFSLNVSDVSFKLAMASLQKGQMPDPASIRSEEFINAFDYRDPEPLQGQPLAFADERARDPFAQERDLLRFSVKAAASGRQDGRALNLVLLLDTSGSMERADRVAIIHEALRVLAGQLQPQDTVSVVSFARTARLWADGMPGDEAGTTLDKVGSITPEGGTNLEEAMRLAYETALRHFIAGGMNRVVLLTDGAANLGNVDPQALTQKVEAERRQGIALDCFGIGWDDYDDDLLEQLSSNGDGRYAFINSPDDAATEFAAKLAGALQVAAEDVKVQVEFNPNRVTAWRQIGYAKHQLTKQQFRDNSVAAGAIATREAGNALYVIETKPDGEGPIATVRVRYRVPGTQDNRERSWLVEYTGAAPELAQSSPAMRLAVSAGEISEWMANSPFAEDVTPDELLNYLSGVPQFYRIDERPKQLEWLIREAKSVSGK